MENFPKFVLKLRPKCKGKSRGKLTKNWKKYVKCEERQKQTDMAYGKTIKQKRFMFLNPKQKNWFVNILKWGFIYVNNDQYILFLNLFSNKLICILKILKIENIFHICKFMSTGIKEKFKMWNVHLIFIVIFSKIRFRKWRFRILKVFHVSLRKYLSGKQKVKNFTYTKKDLNSHKIIWGTKLSNKICIPIQKRDFWFWEKKIICIIKFS